VRANGLRLLILIAAGRNNLVLDEMPNGARVLDFVAVRGGPASKFVIHHLAAATGATDEEQ